MSRSTYRRPLVRLALCLGLFLLGTSLGLHAAQITVDTAKNRVAVSPYLYGKNDSAGSPSSPLSEAEWQRYRDAGIKMLRMHGGNNGTKYNWKKKLSSHPDWYNNVYANDWDYAQTTLQAKMPEVQAMWCFQLIGKVADNTNNNFNDWAYNQSQWWSGVGQNLAGGGTVNPSGSKALKEGNPSLYLTDMDAETTTSILDHWIKPSGLGLDRRQFRYWNMDNEPEIWEGTHDDVMPKQISAEAFMTRYFAAAQLARARFPEIKIVGPVPANEWQWYNWPSTISADGRTYPWLEYFIKRVGEEQRRTGVRLLDVLDIHYYPGATKPADVVQLHRTFFDRTYRNPDANGVYTVNGGWDTSIKEEYIFGRCHDWMDKYLGAGHGVTLGVSEIGLSVTDAPLASVWYASTLGEFIKNGVEVFTPWSWQPGMWEVLHLFSRYNQTLSVSAVSDDETNISAYCTVDEKKGHATLVLINRTLTETKTASVSLANFSIPDGSYEFLRLSGLPSNETFVSHASNALSKSSVSVTNNQCSLSLPPLSITSILLTPERSITPVTVVPSRLINLSVRARSGRGGDVLIVGFVVGGTGSKPVLLRGIGPALKAFGLSGTLPDPLLNLAHQTDGPLASNDNWETGGAGVADASARLGAFALKTGAKDAALYTTVNPGPYTAQIGDVGDGTGVALGEAYDGDISGTSRLINVAARTSVGTGENVLISGFVVKGDTRKTLLVRAIGPGLNQFGVPNTLADPVLSVFRQGDAVPLYKNDNWGSISYAHELATVSASSGAFGITAGSKDAVLVLDLEPGVYSAVVSGAENTTGVALVEVYEVP